MGKAILLAVVFGAFELFAQNNPKNHTSNLTSYSAGSKEDLSRLAGQMIDAINNARAALRNGSHQVGIDDVNQAQSILNRIEARAPGMALVPVYQEFVSVSILSPVLSEQNARTASQTTVSKTSGPAVVHQVAGEYTRMTLDTLIAKKALASAEYDLGMADWKGADQSLSDLQQAVEMESVKSDMPLSRARENLVLARYAARHAQYAEARDSLKAASKSLAEYVADGGPHADQAKTLEVQIKSFAGNVQQERGEVVSKINGWWNTASSWSPYKPADAVESPTGQTASR